MTQNSKTTPFFLNFFNNCLLFADTASIQSCLKILTATMNCTPYNVKEAAQYKL